MTEQQKAADVEQAIENALKDDPTRTHAEISETTGFARSWVTEVLGRRDDLEELRAAFRDGIVIDADENPEVAIGLAERLEDSSRTFGVPADDVAITLAEKIASGDVESVRVEVELA